MSQKMISKNSNASSNHHVIEKMVNGFARQDMEDIMVLFADDAIYQDMSGSGIFGKTMQGKAAIKRHFSFYFKYLMPSHTYEDSVIFAEGNQVCASWTLVLGSRLKTSHQHRVRGCDYFLMENGKVKEKSAFIKISLTTYLAVVRIKLLEFFSVATTSSNVVPQ